MKTMKLIAMLASAVLALSACGGGGGLAPAMPETPAAVPVVVAEPEREDEPEPVAAPAVVPEPVAEAPIVESRLDPATLLQSHDRLSLPDGFNAVLADEAMYLLANIPYRAPEGGGGAGLVAASLALQAGAYALYTAERTEAYTPDHALFSGPWVEHVIRLKPEVVTGFQSGIGNPDGDGGVSSGCHNGETVRTLSGVCIIVHPHPAARNYDGRTSGRSTAAPIEDMPFVSNAMREGSEGVRSRGGVDLRYWSSNGAVPWMRYRNKHAADEYAAETWSGYGAWQQWSGFGLAMLAHNHQWDLYDSTSYYRIAGGDLTGAAPEIVGTWSGAAVATSNDVGIVADGTATMTVRLGANPALDISIGDWRGYQLTERGEIGLPTAVSIDNFEAKDIPIAADGTFIRAGWYRPSDDEWIKYDSNDYSTDRGYRSISGGFYGPGGVEAAGLFSDSGGVSGSFGVRKPKK